MQGIAWEAVASIAHHAVHTIISMPLRMMEDAQHTYVRERQGKVRMCSYWLDMVNLILSLASYGHATDNATVSVTYQRLVPQCFPC